MTERNFLWFLSGRVLVRSRFDYFGKSLLHMPLCVCKILAQQTRNHNGKPSQVDSVRCCCCAVGNRSSFFEHVGYSKCGCTGAVGDRHTKQMCFYKCGWKPSLCLQFAVGDRHFKHVWSHKCGWKPSQCLQFAVGDRHFKQV